jgi:hypothetical protein
MAPATQGPPIDAAALANFLIGGQAPGYGQRYGGFPTAAFGSAAIQGQAFQIADLARQAQALANQRQFDLESAAGKDIAQSRSAIASKYRYAQPTPEVARLARAVQDAETPEQKAAARAQLQSTMGTESTGRRGELSALVDPVQSRLQSDLATQVAPARGIAQALGAFTPSQLAQQIATSRYGYDPMLATGLFGAQTDIDYQAQQQAIRDAQMSQMGYNVGMTNDEILASRLTPEEFQQYQLEKALGSYENTMGDTTAEDQDLFSVYGVLPSNDQEREIMMDDGFANVVANARATMMSQKSVDPRSAAGQIARGFLQQNPGEPARARLLDEILRQYAFLIEDPLAATNINVQL